MLKRSGLRFCQWSRYRFEELASRVRTSHVESVKENDNRFRAPAPGAGHGTCCNLGRILNCVDERRIGLSLNGGFPEDAVTYVHLFSVQKPVGQILESLRPHRSVAGKDID